MITSVKTGKYPLGMKVLFVELAENTKFDLVRLVFFGRICYNWYNLFLYDFRL